MKKILSTLLLLAVVKMSVAQLTLTGKISGATRPDSVEINFSRDGNYWQKNSIYLKTDKSGNFRYSSAQRAPKFAILLYKEKPQYILLTPGRALNVSVSDKANPFSFTGQAKPENDLIAKIHLSNIDDLPFIKELKAKNSYANWSVDSVIRIKLPQIVRSMDSTLNYVSVAAIPASAKALIATEVKYQYAYAVAEKVGSYLNNRKNRDAFYTAFIDEVFKRFALPTKSQLDNGLYTNNYLEIYIQFKHGQALPPYKIRADIEAAKQALQVNYGINLDALIDESKFSGEKYAFITLFGNVVPRYAWERQLGNLMFNFSMSGQLQLADRLLHFIRTNGNDKQYITDAEGMFAPLKKARDQYAQNINIKIRPDYKADLSLAKILEPYKGKVVLIDMWYTQCPPCIAELKFTPALKDQFKKDDVVFLNIAAEPDKNDEIWRDFIFINNMTGEHIRKTEDGMRVLWNELGIRDNEQAYPKYIIIDKTGNIAVNDAKRPSDGEALLNQIKAVLNK